MPPSFRAASVYAPIVDALIGLGWSMSNVPATGLQNICFPLTIVQADHISGYFFAQQFGFVNSSTGYTGLQPRPNDADGRPVLHGVFSSFVPGTTTNDPNCKAGVDGSPDGVSCAFDFPGVYNRTYNLVVILEGAGTWSGQVTDTVTLVRIHIGRWTLPATAGGIRYYQVGFVEWYPWNVGTPPQNKCAKLPYQKTIFGIPSTTNPGSVGTENLAYHSGDCVGAANFHTGKVASGIEVDSGWAGQNGY
ncbi:hypothetical protein C8R46DRAFT_1278488 [Mycena filopes]|nr:hypothetical protein C8R46DRAFT_1278488 [Mycena filopes]